jgi:glycosyltransferase involved in cell wall biosynthesis
MGKIRILYCMETIGGGGVEQRRLSLVRHLAREYFDIKIICTKVVGGMKTSFSRRGVELIEVGEFKHPFEIDKHQKVLRVIRDYKPHIVHGAVFEGNTMACIGGLRGRVPVVILEETSDPQNRSTKANWLLNIYTRFADRIIAISPSVASYLVGTAKIKKQKIQLINNGVETPRRVTEEEVITLKRKYNIQPTDLVIGSVGRLRNFHKLFTDIIEATVLLEDVSNIKILIVGEGQDGALIVETAKRLGLEERLIMVGLQADTAPFYQLMDIYCIASHMEGFGLVAAEAMFHQLPVVATAVGGLKDIVIDRETGFLVPSHRPDKIAEKLQVLIDDPEMRRSMGAKGLARAQQEYSAEVYVGKVHQLYQELLMEKGII